MQPIPCLIRASPWRATRFAAVFASLAVTATGVSTSAIAKPTPRGTGGTNCRDQIRPKTFTTTCLSIYDETTFSARRLHWTHWGSSVTTGRGRFTHCIVEYEPCHTYQGRMQFRKIRDFGACGGVPYPNYTQVRFRSHGSYTPWLTFMDC